MVPKVSQQWIESGIARFHLDLVTSRSLCAYSWGMFQSVCTAAGYVSQRISSWSCTQCCRLNLGDSSLSRGTRLVGLQLQLLILLLTMSGTSEYSRIVLSPTNVGLVRLGSGAGRILGKSSRRPSFIHRSSSEKTLS